MNRKQRKSRLARLRLGLRRLRRAKALRRLQALPPGHYVGRAHTQNNAFGVLVPSPVDGRPVFFPTLRLPTQR